MAARGSLAIFKPIAQQAGLPGVNQLLLPECALPITDPARCAEAIKAKTLADQQAKASRFGQNLIGPVVTLASFIPGIGTAVNIASNVATKLAQEPPRTQPILLQPRGGTMAFEDGDSGFFGSFPSIGEIGQTIGNVLQGSLGQGLLEFGTQYALNQLTPATMAAVPPAVRTMAGAGAVARVGATVGRSFFNRFPNLATAIQSLRNRGANVTRSQLWSLMKRFGPDFLITGGILTAAAVSELAMAGPGRRRMNPGNVHALRRAHRRMKSFHRVCQVNDHMLGSRRRSSKRGAPCGTSITRVS